MTQILLIPHLDAGDRSKWSADQDHRPLSDLGRQQAEALREALSDTPVRALYASPALRCHQTLEPLAEANGLQIQTMPDLVEKQFGEDRVTLAKRGWSALQAVGGEVAEGVAAVCSHGDLIPAVVELLVRDQGIAAPAPLSSRGQWYEIEFAEGSVTALTLQSGSEPLAR